MQMIDIIAKKRDKKILTKEEIKFVIDGYVNNQIPDYQISALLMAIYLNGMNDEETVFLTELMMNSGDVINLDDIEGIKLDKHSTGGVGDKVSLVLGPILAACGAKVAKMSGRGLGHTGGTLDKLESIAGFNCFLSEQEFKNFVNKSNLSIVGQTNNLVPADKKIYALRDVTATVGSMPLIAASVLSKKFATGSDAILIDLKCGSGAFMKTISEARELGQLMIKIGKKMNKNIQIEISNMEQPLGKMVGNKNEILEAINSLKGQGDPMFMDLIFSSGSTMLVQAKKANNLEVAKKMIKEVIENGNALAKFLEMIENQGGNSKIIQEQNWWNPKYELAIKSPKAGYVYWHNSVAIGMAAMKLGAGRKTKEDQLDFEAGIEIVKVSNEKVNQGDVIMKLYSSQPIAAEIALEIEKKSLKINKEMTPIKMILDQLN